MKKDLSEAIKKLNGMRECDVVSSGEIANLFGVKPNGMSTVLKNTAFTQPDVKSGRFLFWSKKALSAEIARRQEKTREHDTTVVFYARLSRPVAEFAKKKGGLWLERILEREMKKSQKNS